MITPKRMLGLFCGAAILACLMACGNIQQASARAKRTNDIKQLGIAWHNYHDSNGKGPQDQQAFLMWAQKMQPEAVGIIQQTAPGGSITVHYGPFKLVEFLDGTTNTVLAYDNADWSGNRIVLMADGSIRYMKPAELQAAPKPKLAQKGK